MSARQGSDARARLGWEQRHCYGDAVHILDNLYLLTALARLSGSEVRHPELVNILRQIYQVLMVAVSGLLLPDPMGATGSTTLRAVSHYLKHHGRPARIVAMPMIATPEYLRAVQAGIEDIVVYTARLDRGLSAAEVLACVPGERWDEERGLNGAGYIVPGAGGLGEVLNNSWC